MERVRPIALVLSALLLGAVGARGRPRRRRSSTPEPPVPSRAAPPVVDASAVADLQVKASGAPRALARLDRGLATLGTIGFVVTVGLAVWEAAGIGPAPGAAGGLDWPLVTLLGTLIVWAVYLFWKVPQWQAGGQRAATLDGKERFEIENAARGTLGQMLSGLAVIAGLLFAWQQLGSASETLRVSQEGQITERFTRAVDQLGSDDATIRLGGIYALERIARDSERDRGPVAEVLAAYLRDHAPRVPPGGTPATTSAGPPIDVRAVLTILTGDEAPRNGAACLDLSNSDLSGANLGGADLERACLTGTTLVGAGLERARLTDATLDEADLSSARLGKADLAGASLAGASLAGTDLSQAALADVNLLTADLDGAVLVGATLAGASFNGATISNATLFGVDLLEARALTQEQVDAALTDRQTRLPDGLESRPDM